MNSFILRNIDPKLWAAVKKRAAGEGRTIRWVVLRLLQLYAREGLSLDTQKRD
jgi:hypothetical protein